MLQGIIALKAECALVVNYWLALSDHFPQELIDLGAIGAQA